MPAVLTELACISNPNVNLINSLEFEQQMT